MQLRWEVCDLNSDWYSCFLGLSRGVASFLRSAVGGARIRGVRYFFD